MFFKWQMCRKKKIENKIKKQDFPFYKRWNHFVFKNFASLHDTQKRKCGRFNSYTRYPDEIYFVNKWNFPISRCINPPKKKIYKLY